MIEKVPSASELTPEGLTPGGEALHNSSISVNLPDIDPAASSPLNARGLSGNVVAVLGLPTGVNFRGEKVRKEIAIIDYGSSAVNNKVPVFRGEDGQNLDHIFGSTEPGKRYGLAAANYTPEQHLASYQPIDSEWTTLGRDPTSPISRRLGLEDASNGNNTTSKGHVSVRVTDGGRLDIVDHSTNGTDVIFIGDRVASGDSK